MRVLVDFDSCQRHGRCCIAAPEVFSLDEDGILIVSPNADDASRARVEEAADLCPTQSITIVD